MAVTTFRWKKIVKSVHTEMRWTHTYFGVGEEAQYIVVTWTERKLKSKKIKPMMGDDYRITETYEVTSVQSFPYTVETYNLWVSRIGQPEVKQILDDPVDIVGRDD